MSKTADCNCSTGCTNKRCSCNKAFEGCDTETCGCTECKNPYNEVDPEAYSTCALDHIENVKNLSDEERETEHDLPCGDTSLRLEQLLDTYACDGCGEEYWFSFCLNEPVQDCVQWRMWHCENCDRCTYGVTRPCEYCGRDGPMAEEAVEF